MSKSKQLPEKKEAYLFFLCSGLTVLCGLLLLSKMYPLHINSHTAHGQDPAYQYLFAGIDILRGHAPYHTDHPGTPLQSLIACTTATLWALMQVAGLETYGIFDSALLHPELYLGSVSFVLLLLSGAAIYYLGTRVYRVTGSYLLSIGCQLSPLLFPAVVPNLVFPTPEALLIPIVITLLGVMTPIIFCKDKSTEKDSLESYPAAGLLCGIGVATKITFLPILAILFLFKPSSVILRAFIFAVIGWLIGVAPIFERLPSMFSWFYQVLSHSGAHGEGSRGLIDSHQFSMALSWLARNFELYYYTLIFLVTIVVLSLARHWLVQDRQNISANLPESTDRIDLRVPVVLVLIMSAQTVMVAKHPGVTYMIPALPFAILGGAWVINNLAFFRIQGETKHWISVIWFVCVLTISLVSFTEATSTLAKNQNKGQRSYEAINNELKKYKNPVLVGAFNCNFIECAEWFGMLLVPEMELRMKQVTPNFLHFDIFNKRLHVPGIGELTEDGLRTTINELIAQNRDVLLISPEFDQLHKFELEKLLSTEIQNLYRIKGLVRQ
ncbi:uncharacterized protein DUF2029 [Jezberella montanilacus]|uniref:Uncharacterized protein DUF2029 n=2 Tax=Jezberella montanilacus TaxID=323426 RepID=A0A2T0XIA0_9BURK|nr:uncharacterized protein DUF2029 [Jezberella montanilacus]